MCQQSNKGPLRDLAVVDPTFNSGPEYMNVIARLIRGQLRGKISLQCRLEMMTDEFLMAVLELSRTALVVLEFGVQSIRKAEQKVIDRPCNMRKMEYWLECLNKNGVAYEMSFIYGLPMQTAASFIQTTEWANSFICQHSTSQAVARFFPLMLLRGTPLHDRAEEFGLQTCTALGVDLTGRVGTSIPHVVQSNTFSVDEWYEMHTIAESFNCAPSRQF